MWIEYNKYEELARKGITLDMCYILSLLNGEKLPNTIVGTRIHQTVLTLVRKGFAKVINEPFFLYTITEEGKKILSFILGVESDIGLAKIEIPQDPFTRWWNVFPTSDSFTHKGQKFKATRSLKITGDKFLKEQRNKIEAILKEGEYTIEQLIAALQYEVLQKKEESIRKGENKMTYFRNSLTYINQRNWVAFMDDVKSGAIVKEEIKSLDTII